MAQQCCDANHKIIDPKGITYSVSLSFSNIPYLSVNAFMKQLLLLIFCGWFFPAQAQLLIRNTTVVDVEAKKLLPAQDV